MRKLFVLVILSAIVFAQASAQRISVPVVNRGPAASSLPSNFYAPNAVGNTFNTSDIQTQFSLGQWTRGNVKFKNGQEMKDMMLLFDVHSNILYFLQDKLTMEFNFPVYEFEIGLLFGPDTVNVRYRSSYPAVNNNTGETFYEIVVDGGIQLLWCRAKSVKLYKDNTQPEPRRNTEKEQWYAHMPDGRMIKLKKDKNEIIKALPEYADRINEIVRARSLRLKESEHLVDLFAALNGL